MLNWENNVNFYLFVLKNMSCYFMFFMLHTYIYTYINILCYFMLCYYELSTEFFTNYQSYYRDTMETVIKV